MPEVHALFVSVCKARELIKTIVFIVNLSILPYVILKILGLNTWAQWNVYNLRAAWIMVKGIGFASDRSGIECQLCLFSAL